MGIKGFFKSAWQKISSAFKKEAPPSQPQNVSKFFAPKPTTTTATKAQPSTLAPSTTKTTPTTTSAPASATAKQSSGGYYISEKGAGYTIKDVKQLKPHEIVSLVSGKATFVPLETEQKQTTTTTKTTSSLSQQVTLTPSLQKAIEERSQIEKARQEFSQYTMLKPSSVVVKEHTEIPASERIVKEPSTFQKIVGFALSPFATLAQAKYSSPVAPTQYEIHKAFTPSGRGTSEITPAIFSPEFAQFGVGYPEEIKKKYPQAYAWAEIKKAEAEIITTRQKEYERAVTGALLQQQMRAQREYEKTAQSIYEKEIRPQIEPKYQALAQTGKYSEAELQKMYVKEAESLLSQHPALKEIEQNFRNVSESIAGAYASKYQTLASADIERKTSEILKGFQTGMKSEVIKGKALDIPWQVGLSVGIGAAVGAGATAISKIVPEGIVRTAGGMALLTKSELATAGGLTLGAGVTALAVKDLAREFSATKQLDKGLAYKELAVNVASLIGAGAGFAVGYGIGAREMSKKIASTEITREYSLNVMQEVGKRGVIGKGYTIQQVSYEVPLLFTKKPMQELRFFEYPFAGAVKPGGAGKQALAFLEKSTGKVLGTEIAGTKAKGYFIFGEATLRQYEPFKGGWALAKETMIKPQELFGKVISVSKGKQAFFTELGEKRVLRYPSEKELYFTTSEFEKGIRGGGVSKELKRLGIEFKSREFSIKAKTLIRTFAQAEIRERTISRKLSFLIPKIKPETEKITFVPSVSKPFKLTTQLARQTQLQKVIPTPKFEIPAGRQGLIFTTKLTPPASISKEITKTITMPTLKSVKISKQLSRQLQYQIPSFKLTQRQAERQGIIFSQTQIGRLRSGAFRGLYRTITKELGKEKFAYRFDFKQLTQPLLKPQVTFAPHMPYMPSFSMPIIPLPSLPKIGFEFRGGMHSFFARGRGYKYQPSLSAITLGIKAPSIPKTTELGFTIRPILIKSRKKRR